MTAAPSAALTMPAVEAPIPDLVNNILGGKQYISPSYWLGWAMEKVCGVNPWSWLADNSPVTGTPPPKPVRPSNSWPSSTPATPTPSPQATKR